MQNDVPLVTLKIIGAKKKDLAKINSQGRKFALK